MDAVDRIFETLDKKNIEQKKLASLLNVSPDKVSNWRVRRSKSYTKYLPQIAQALGTTVEYLLTGNTVANEDSQEEESASDKDIKFALFGTADIDDDVYESVKQFAKFAAEQKRGKKTND